MSDTPEKQTFVAPSGSTIEVWSYGEHVEIASCGRGFALKRKDWEAFVAFLAKRELEEAQ